jgi:hypothetical protein
MIITNPTTSDGGIPQKESREPSLEPVQASPNKESRKLKSLLVNFVYGIIVLTLVVMTGLAFTQGSGSFASFFPVYIIFLMLPILPAALIFALITQYSGIKLLLTSIVVCLLTYALGLFVTSGYLFLFLASVGLGIIIPIALFVAIGGGYLARSLSQKPRRLAVVAIAIPAILLCVTCALVFTGDARLSSVRDCDQMIQGRDECIIRVANERKDPAICSNLLSVSPMKCYEDVLLLEGALRDSASCFDRNIVSEQHEFGCVMNIAKFIHNPDACNGFTRPFVKQQCLRDMASTTAPSI